MVAEDGEAVIHQPEGELHRPGQSHHGGDCCEYVCGHVEVAVEDAVDGGGQPTVDQPDGEVLGQVAEPGTGAHCAVQARGSGERFHGLSLAGAQRPALGLLRARVRRVVVAVSGERAGQLDSHLLRVVSAKSARGHHVDVLKSGTTARARARGGVINRGGDASRTRY